MTKKKPSIVWDIEARNAFKKAIAYIKKSSSQNGDMVRLDINTAVKKLAEEPERLHTPDKYKISTAVVTVFFEIHHYRISYFTSEGMIRIIRFRHTSQQPEIY